MKMKTPLLVLLGIILLGGLFLFFKPKNQTKPIQTNIQENKVQAISPSPTPESKIKTFELVVKGKKLVSGPATISVTQDDEVVIKITADEEEEFHIHGYDKFVDVEKDKQATLTFTANLTGRFPFELEHSKTEIGALEVQPKE